MLGQFLKQGARRTAGIVLNCRAWLVFLNDLLRIILFVYRGNSVFKLLL